MDRPLPFCQCSICCFSFLHVSKEFGLNLKEVRHCLIITNSVQFLSIIITNIILDKVLTQNRKPPILKCPKFLFSTWMMRFYVFMCATFCLRVFIRTILYYLNFTIYVSYILPTFCGGGRNRIGRREKWPKKGWEEGETGGKSREEGEKVR